MSGDVRGKKKPVDIFNKLSHCWSIGLDSLCLSATAKKVKICDTGCEPIALTVNTFMLETHILNVILTHTAH